MRHQHQWNIGHQRNWRKILDRIVGRRLVEIGRNDERVFPQIQRISVGRGLCGGYRADNPASTDAVVDHHLLPQGIADLLADDPRNRVDRGTRAERRDDPDRLGRIGLGVRARQRGKSRYDGQHECHCMAHGSAPKNLRHSIFTLLSSMILLQRLTSDCTYALNSSGDALTANGTSRDASKPRVSC